MENNSRIEEELKDLKQELEDFKHEKERVRAIVGKAGGVPTFDSKLFNISLGSLIGIFMIISLIGGQELRLLMIEFATVALSVKIIYLIHCQSRVNHFKFWILSSIEWRLNELTKLVRHLKD